MKRHDGYLEIRMSNLGFDGQTKDIKTANLDLLLSLSRYLFHYILFLSSRLFLPYADAQRIPVEFFSHFSA